MTQPTTTDVAIVNAPDELELAERARRERRPVPANNGLLHPDRWEMFGRIANTVSGTEFVPKGLRGNPPAVMACLLYGDALGLHPNVALTEVHIVDGRPTMSATLMVGMIRRAGHRIKREELRDDQGRFLGTTAHGIRGDDGETDAFTFTLEMAQRAGLLTKQNWRNYPEAMCWARCVSQLARMLFPDVFLGQSAYTGEELGLAETTEDGAPVPDSHEQPQIERPDEPDETEAPPADAPPADAPQAAAAVEEPVEVVEHPVDEQPVDEPVEDAETTPVETTAEQQAFATLGSLTIPKIMEAISQAQERGDVAFLHGILAHEQSEAGKGRKNLIATLEDTIAEMEEAERRYGAAQEAEQELAEQAAALEESRAEHGSDVELPVNAFAAALAEQEEAPPAAPVAGRPVVTNITAASAWLLEHHPEQAKPFKVESLVVSAQHIYGSEHAEPIHSLDDLTDDELAQVWQAVPAPAKEAVAALDDGQRAQLAAKALVRA